MMIGNMYVIFKRDEIGEKLHLKRSALDNAINLLKEYNLIQEKKQGKNLPNIIYIGKTIGTIENEKDRKMTIMTTTFIPCGAKLPIIALIAGALFPESSWVGPSAYFIGIGAIIINSAISTLINILI